MYLLCRLNKTTTKGIKAFLLAINRMVGKTKTRLERMVMRGRRWRRRNVVPIMMIVVGLIVCL